jgi:tRNA U34 2-thiouridine synthase MnmA/TrmU
VEEEVKTLCCAASLIQKLKAPHAAQAAPKTAPLHLRFPQAQWAVTPGQSAVLYDGEVCLGGGVIASVGDIGELPARSVTAVAA